MCLKLRLTSSVNTADAHQVRIFDPINAQDSIMKKIDGSFSIAMGHNYSCLSHDTGNKISVRNPSKSSELKTTFNSHTSVDSVELESTRPTSNVTVEEIYQLDQESGYNLVDLKGDKIHHMNQDTLVGCEIYAPGLGIGLIVSPVSQTICSIQYKVQMADGRNVIVSIRKCTKSQVASANNLNPRIFVMQRLF